MSSDQSPVDEVSSGEIDSVDQSDHDRADLIAELETLRAETERLRGSYVRARRNQYRRTALGFAALGIVATIAGVLFPTTRTVLLAFGGTGLFAALLTLFITPERFVSADVGDAVYEALIRNNERIIQELGLTEQRVYVPRDETTDEVRLFIPQQSSFQLPGPEEMESLFVVTDDEAMRGVSLQPTGAPLFREFRETLTGPLGDSPADIIGQVREAVVEQFEIAEGIDADLGPENDRLSLRITESPYGSITRFDHPVVSTIAVSLAQGLGRPVRIELSDETNPVATLRWDLPVEERHTAATDS